MIFLHSLCKTFLSVLVITGILTCQNIVIPNPLNESTSKLEISGNSPAYNLLLIDLLASQIGLTPDECTNTYLMINLYWPFTDYYGRISSDTRDYETIIGIDSTIDIASKYEGFLNIEKTFSVAVPGNTACDAIRQLGTIKTPNPKNFVISTADGNGLFYGVNANYSIQTVKRLIDKIRNRWPGIRIIVIGIHPTLIQRINAYKDYTNSEIRTYLQSIENSCYYDPLPLFGVGPGEPAPASLMYDDRHYKKSISFQIKDELQTFCNISL